MKTLLFCVALLVAGTACADELADADALFAKKAYPEALQKYTKLANAGNVTAQQHLGEMYFYGEAGDSRHGQGRRPGSARRPPRAMPSPSPRSR